MRSRPWIMAMSGESAPGKGPLRVYPPQGAHSERRIPPRSLWYLGTCLAALRATGRGARHVGSPAHEPGHGDTARNLRLPGATSCIAPRTTAAPIRICAAASTPDTASCSGPPSARRKKCPIHLQQIDQGPNYRWGWAGEGGCGVLYFFAAGKAYSFNGSEDVGDRRDQDTDFCTNFGVYKDGEFRSIGQNVLSRPFYDLGAGQFAEIVPRKRPDAYSAPEYVSRSVLLAGHDYFVLYDAVLNQSIAHRLSWFVRRGSELPIIQLVRGADPKGQGNAAHRYPDRRNHGRLVRRRGRFHGRGQSSQRS